MSTAVALLMFVINTTGLTLHRAQFLSALLCLEGMMLSLFIALSVWALQLNTTNFSSTPLLLMAFSACEASTGLALLIATSRTHGTAQLQNLNLLQC